MIIIIIINIIKILKGFVGTEEQLFFRKRISNTRGPSMKLYKNRVKRDVSKYSFANKYLNRYQEKLLMPIV